MGDFQKVTSIVLGGKLVIETLLITACCGLITGNVPQSNFKALVKFKLGWMFVFGFFSSISLLHAIKKLDIFSLLFVALSHCDKQNFCLWH